MILIVYVDDIIITGDDSKGLLTYFHTKDTGKLRYFLGIEVAWSKKGVVCHNGSMCWIFLMRWV